MNQVRGARLANALYDNYEKIAEERGKVYAWVQNSFALDKYLTGNGENGFTRENGVRETIVDFSRDEIAEFFANSLYAYAKEDVAKNDLEKEIFYKIGMQEMFGAKKEDIVRNIIDCMLGKTKEAYGISSRSMMDLISKTYEQEVFPKIEQERKALAEQVEKNVDPRFGVRKLNVNVPAINYCRQEVLCGTQISLQNDIKARDPNRRPRREYNVDDIMLAVTDIGNKRKEQQDAVSILYHPSSKAYKMLVVADGMGGMENGDKASQELVRQMTIWFEGLNPEYLKEGKERELAEMWDKKLLEINKEIISEYPGSGSTFVGAIVGEKSTLVASVGDSRAYVIGQDNNLYQVTKDDNLQFWRWNDFKNDILREKISKAADREEEAAWYSVIESEKERLRFHKNANQITDAIGLDDIDGPSIQFKRFLNSGYKTLMLFSDGVTDCLSDKQLMAITQSTKPSDLARAIVDKALNTDSKLEDVGHNLLANPNNYVSSIPAGKDNTTAAVYHNTDGEER